MVDDTYSGDDRWNKKNLVNQLNRTAGQTVKKLECITWYYYWLGCMTLNSFILLQEGYVESKFWLYLGTV